MNPRAETPPVPAWLAPLPFLLFAKGGSDEDLVASSALASAAAALSADPDRRDSRSRVCFLLAELAAQFARRTGNHSGRIPVQRAQLARAAQISLPKVKRVLGFLALSGVIELRENAIRVVDWQRLCLLGAYDRSWLRLPVQEDEEEELPSLRSVENAEASTCTAAGDPASFV